MFLYRAGGNSVKQALSARSGKLARALALVCLILLTPEAGVPAHAQSTADEYQIKAAFLFHFAQLVGWPAGALSASDASITLCIFDDEPHRQQLQEAIEGKPAGARIFHLRMLNRTQTAQGCNLLFLSRDELRRQTATLKIVRGLPVLTVGESADFLTDGGMIRFHLDEDRIRFDINLAAADSSHLTISSRLLLLASVVMRGNGAEKGK